MSSHPGGGPRKLKVKKRTPRGQLKGRGGTVQKQQKEKKPGATQFFCARKVELPRGGSNRVGGATVSRGKLQGVYGTPATKYFKLNSGAVVDEIIVSYKYAFRLPPRMNLERAKSGLSGGLACKVVSLNPHEEK